MEMLLTSEFHVQPLYVFTVISAVFDWLQFVKLVP